jgi:glycosyltransferase involved in cell wall biosynthesis
MLLKAWAIVEKADAEWTLDIYGDGNKHYYQRIVDELQLDTERCHLNDSVADVQKKYLDSSLFVCSSRFEGFGMMLVEAMACGLPVVSFDCQWGPRSIIADGQDGLLVADGNVDALAEGLSRLMADEPLRLQMGRAARENVKRFRIDAIAARWQALFTEVCNSEKN